jgi:hypothetical protein
MYFELKQKQYFCNLKIEHSENIGQSSFQMFFLKELRLH